MNFFSYDIRSLLHQDHRDPNTEFPRHRDDRELEELHCADGYGKPSEKTP